MENYNLNSLSLSKFPEFMGNRAVEKSKASDELSSDIPAVNKLSKLLHPESQSFVVCEIIEHNEFCKSFLLKAENGCAYFSAGQYVSVFVDIEGKKYSRPYSLSSSPKDSLSGIYRITVKAVSGGLVSNYILNNWEIGTKVTTSGPQGNFTYEPLRDASHVLAVAGGSGITPFISLAKAIAEGDEDFSLTLLYGAKTESEILFKDELEALSKKCEKIRTVYVLSHEDNPKYENGFINESIIKKYIPKNLFSVFICGPQAMIRFVKSELESFSLEKKYIRCELPGEVFLDSQNETVMITVNVHGEKSKVKAEKSESILRSLEKSGIYPPSSCRSGECGFCRSRLISGEVYIPEDMDKRRKADLKYGYIHPCCTFPLTDIEMEVFPK